MTSCCGESRVVEVVGLDLIVPEVDIVRGVGVSTICQVLTVVWRSRVGRRALSGVVGGIVGKSLIPCHVGDTVERSVLVVPINHGISEVGGNTSGSGRGSRGSGGGGGSVGGNGRRAGGRASGSGLRSRSGSGTLGTGTGWNWGGFLPDESDRGAVAGISTQRKLECVVGWAD